MGSIRCGRGGLVQLYDRDLRDNCKGEGQRHLIHHMENQRCVWVDDAWGCLPKIRVWSILHVNIFLLSLLPVIMMVLAGNKKENAGVEWRDGAHKGAGLRRLRGGRQRLR